MADPAYLQKGLSLLQQATLLDSQGQISQAISHYLLGLEVLVKVHGYEKIDANKALLKGKIEAYMSRVEELKAISNPKPVAAPSKPPVASAPPDDLALPPVPTSTPSRQRTGSSTSPGRGGGGAGSHLSEKTVSIKQDATGHSYRTLFRDYLVGAVRVTVEDPYLKTPHQLGNLLRFLELIVKVNDCYEIEVITRPDVAGEQHGALQEMQRSLQEAAGLKLSWKFSDSLHDRCIRLSNGWRIVLGRGLDFYQKPLEGSGKYFIGAFEQSVRKCLECDVIYLRDK